MTANWGVFRQARSARANQQWLGRMRRMLVTALLAVAMPASAQQQAPGSTASGRDSVNTEATGRILCDGAPMAGVQVDLMWSKWSVDDFFDTVMGTAVTDASGRFDVSGVGGGFWGPPAPYVRAVYDVFPDVTAASLRILNELGSVRSDHLGTRDHDWQPGIIAMGDLEFGGLDCELWTNLYQMLNDYQTVHGSFPFADLDILHWSAIYFGTPWTSLETIHWPTNYPAFRRTVFHEASHSVRHSLDGDLSHFIWDALRFTYARSHSEPDLTNEGFAFNEGWAEFWETRSASPPLARAYYNSPPNWNVEGDVAAELRRLANCFGSNGASDGVMVDVLAQHPGAIHSRDEFFTYFHQMYPNACATPPPPPPGACASGAAAQGFWNPFQAVVGCPGHVAQKDAGSLCGPGFSLCSAAVYVQGLYASPATTEPTHDYWTSDQLDFWDNQARRCAARHAGANACAGASMHACTRGGGDAEGNTCNLTNCSLDPSPGDEFPVNVFLGGCGAGDTTAGAVCCGPVRYAPIQELPDFRQLHDRDRATLLQAIASLEAKLASTRNAAALPQSCTQPRVCETAIEALVLPALLQGVIDTYRAYLKNLDESTISMQDLQAQVAKGTFDATQRAAARSQVLALLEIKRQAVKAAMAALQPALASRVTAGDAELVAQELTQELADLDRMSSQPDKVSPNLQPWKPEQWRRLATGRR